MIDLLNLPNYTLVSRRDTDFETIFTIRYLNPPILRKRINESKKSYHVAQPRPVLSYGVDFELTTFTLEELKSVDFIQRIGRVSRVTSV